MPFWLYRLSPPGQNLCLGWRISSAGPMAGRYRPVTPEHSRSARQQSATAALFAIKLLAKDIQIPNQPPQLRRGGWGGVSGPLPAQCLTSNCRSLSLKPFC
jgi:hypothetical protein